MGQEPNDQPNQKRKICIVVANRANYARIKSTLFAVQNHPDLELQLVVSASALLARFGNVIDIITADGFKPDCCIHVIVEGESPQTMAKSTGLAIMEMATAFENLAPDIVLTVADRYETMATAIAASYMNIPLAHTQGGEVTGNIDESVRHAVTKLAHIHFPATEESAERICKLGEDPKTIFMTGCPAMDLLPSIADEPLNHNIHQQYGGVGEPVDLTKPYLVVMQHPVTTEYGQGFEQIQQTLDAVEQSRQQAIWFWPNVDAGSDDVSKGLRVFREKKTVRPIHFCRNMTPEDYARLINHCACLVGNSSSGIREGAFLGTPVVNIGGRQEGRERGENVIDVNYTSIEILSAVHSQMNHGKYERSNRFGEGHAGQQIANILSTVKPEIKKRITY